MALSPLNLLDMLRDEIPAGSQGGKFNTLCQQAVRDAVAYGAARSRERVDTDLWGDGVTTRFALTGRSVRLLDVDDWLTPTNLNTAGIAAPSIAATYAPGTGGTLPAGVYLACYAWETALGVTSPTIPVPVTVAANGKITRAIVTPPAGATVADYLSSAAGTGTLLRVATGGTGAPLDLASLPAATAPVAQVDYTSLGSFTAANLAPGVAPDGSVNAAVSTLTLGTAIPAGSRARVAYTRIPLYPALPTSTIGLDDDYLRLAAKAHLCRALALNPRSGDSTDYTNMEKELFAQLDALLATASGRRAPRITFVSWA